MKAAHHQNSHSDLSLKQKKCHLFPPGLEPGTFRVLGERDNHYTTESLELWCEENIKTVFWCLEITLTGLYSLLFSR